MHFLKTSILIWTISASPLAANDSTVTLEFRPVADIGSQATATTGPAGEPAIQVAGGETKSTTELISFDIHDFSALEYVVRGRVKYDDVQGDGYLELWHDFGDKKKSFTRSIDDWGTGKKLSGTSDWREFELPFYADPNAKLRRLILNIVLPGKGKVTISQPLVVEPLKPMITLPANITSVPLEFRPVADVGPQATTSVGPGGEPGIEIIGTEAKSTSELIRFNGPALSANEYVVRGRVKYDGVVGDGYLELWNDFGKQGKFFTRSFSDSGTLGKLSGTSGWRDFELPFYSLPGKAPQRLTLNVVLPGKGKVIVAQPLAVEPLKRLDAPPANKASVILELRSIADIGAQATASNGPAGEAAVEVVGSEVKSTTELIRCDDPQITAKNYVVRGRVKYDGVVGDGYLELWNDFGEKGTYFSRSLDKWGTMRKLSGTSDWRDFELPFYAEGLKPRRLTLNVVLPGKGKVTVTGPLIVVPLNSLGHWWTDQQAAWCGGIFGSMIGILGASLGVSAGLFKSRKLTMGLCGLGLAIGCVALPAGIVAILAQQPYHVYYPLLLIGLICVGVFGGNFRQISRRFQDEEIRRMQAADAV